MQSLLGQVAGWREKCSEKVLDAKSVQVQRVQQRTSSIQVRHSKVDKMGREFNAVLSEMWKLRFRHEQQCDVTEMQHVRCYETFARLQSCTRLQSCKTKNETLFDMAMQRL